MICNGLIISVTQACVVSQDLFAGFVWCPHVSRRAHMTHGSMSCHHEQSRIKSHRIESSHITR